MIRSITDQINLNIKPEIIPFVDDQDTHTISYIVKDPDGPCCVVIDSVLNFDMPSGRIGHDYANQMLNYIRKHQLKVVYHIETHVHADHLSAAKYLQHHCGGKIIISEKIVGVQSIFSDIFDEGDSFQSNGSQFGQLLTDEQSYQFGGLTGIALATPGHTPACMSHIIGDACFVGDTLFMPDSGTARADFPGGDAGILYDSIQKLLSLPSQMRLFMCHDYGGATNQRLMAWETTIEQERNLNIHIGGGKTRDEFIALRTKRDQTLAVPHLILPSLQVNMRAGDIPMSASGRMMLKLPVNAFV